MKKTALVTGASGGIGSAIARQLSKDGYTLALVYNKNEEKAKALQKELSSESYIFKCDISSPEEIKTCFKEAQNLLGEINVLVNNAGIAQQKLFTEITDEDWQKMIATNLSGAFYFSREALKPMISRKCGKIINITSMWGETGGSCEVHYSAAKAGIIGMTKALAKEVGLSGITANAVSPGVIQTDMLSSFSEEDLEALKEEIPINRLGTPEDVAKAVSFLASDNANYITGQILSVNGGIVI